MAGQIFGSPGPRPGMSAIKPARKPVKTPPKPTQVVGGFKSGPIKTKPTRPTKPMHPRKK